MSETISVDGEEYELDANPTLRTVRNVQSMQLDILLQHISEDELQEMDDLEDEGELIRKIVEKEGYSAFQDVMWENSMLQPVQTISLAADNQFDSDDFDDVGAQDFKEMQEKAKVALGGNADDFFSELGIGSFLTEEEMQSQVQEAT